MDFLGIGPLEVLFVLLIALIVFGPKDIVKAGQTMGRFLRKLVISPSWQTFQQTSRDLRNLPTKLIREAGLDEIQQDLKQISPNVAIHPLRPPVPNPEGVSLPPKVGKTEGREQTSQVQEGISAWTTPAHTISTPEKTSSPIAPQPEQTEAD